MILLSTMTHLYPDIFFAARLSGRQPLICVLILQRACVIPNIPSGTPAQVSVSICLIKHNYFFERIVLLYPYRFHMY
jgi:hypothetical protein